MKPPFPPGTWLRALLLTIAGVALLLIVNNYALEILPRGATDLLASEIERESPAPAMAYVVPFEDSEADDIFGAHSRIEFHDGNLILGGAHATLELVRANPGFWRHEDHRIIFSTYDGSDPRANGRSYWVTYPLLYGYRVGLIAILAFGLAVIGLWFIKPPSGSPTAAAAAPRGGWNFHFWTAMVVFLVGLYLNTGTLTPYANTTLPYVDPPTGYLYSPDQPHFRALFDFVDGREKSRWDGALLLRRILYNVYAYPFMKIGGFKVGGTIASIVLNLAAFALFVRSLRRSVGARGASLAAWLLALYPGAAYWVGLPYLYALIVPGSLLLMIALTEIAEKPGWRPVLLGSLALGLGNLGYEFFGYFLPATLLILAWQRRWTAAVVATVLQVAPLALWILILQHGFGQTIDNSNSGAFGAIASAYLHVRDYALWRAYAAPAFDIGWNVFFGANFIFLPMLFLLVVALNPVTSRVRAGQAEVALLAAGLALFLFNNLAPYYFGVWQLRGIWIARIYQPVLPALIVFCARWYERLPPLSRLARGAIAAALVLPLAGNALVVFGPILGNPLHLSEIAFYRFYDHANHANYAQNLKTHGRRPLGFARPTAP